MKQVKFNLKHDIAIPQGDGSYVVYLKRLFRAGYYVDKFDPVAKEAVIGLALYRADGEGQPIRIGNPMRVTSEKTYGPMVNEAELRSARQERDRIQGELDQVSSNIAALKAERANAEELGQEETVATLDEQIQQLEAKAADIEQAMQDVEVPDPQYEWELDFDMLTAMAPNLELTPSFIDFVGNIRTSFGVKISDIIDVESNNENS